MMIRLLTGLRKSQNFHEVGIKMQLENSFGPIVLPLITTLHCPIIFFVTFTTELGIFQFRYHHEIHAIRTCSNLDSV